MGAYDDATARFVDDHLPFVWAVLREQGLEMPETAAALQLVWLRLAELADCPDADPARVAEVLRETAETEGRRERRLREWRRATGWVSASPSTG